MKKFILTACVIALLPACNYVGNRANDAMDIFTLTTGTGFGGMAQVGPLHAGLGIYQEWWGLRGGEIGKKGGTWIDPVTKKESAFGLTIEYTLGGYSELACAREWSKLYFSYDYPNHQWYGFPLITIPQSMNNKPYPASINPAWFDVHAGGGALFGVRAGLNLAELADFFLGFAEIDFLNDDAFGREELGTDSEIVHIKNAYQGLLK